MRCCAQAHTVRGSGEDAPQGICGTPTDTLSVAVVVGDADGGLRPRPKPRPSARAAAATTPAKTTTGVARGEQSRAGVSAPNWSAAALLCSRGKRGDAAVAAAAIGLCASPV